MSATDLSLQTVDDCTDMGLQLVLNLTTGAPTCSECRGLPESRVAHPSIRGTYESRRSIPCLRAEVTGCECAYITPSHLVPLVNWHASQTKNTLRMLHNEHVKAGKELQRRIAKLREENQDPTLPQKAPPRNAQLHMHRNGGSSNAAPPAPVPAPFTPMYASSSSRLLDSHNNVDESFMVLGQRVRLYLF